MSSDADAASAQMSADSSTATFLSALIFNAALGVGFFTAFSVIRTWNKKVYEGRTYLVEKNKRSPPLSRGFWGWQRELLSTSDSDIIKRVGLDAYMFLKFMRLCALLFTIFTVLALPILMPLNSINQLGSTGIDAYTMGNVKDKDRFWAHLILAVIFTITIIHFTWKEMKNYIDLRQRHLVSEGHVTSVVAKTILVTAIPDDYNTEEKLKEVFDKFPGGVETIFINRNVGKLSDDAIERENKVMKLEGAETAYIKAGVKYLHNSKAPANKKEGDHEKDVERQTSFPESLRPCHRTGFLGLYGKKVDSITTYREEIVKLNEKIAAEQARKDEFPKYSSAFIRFRTQIAAHMSAQSVIHSLPLSMTPRFVEIDPRDVVWENLNMGSIERLVRTVISLTIVTAIVSFWAIPTAFVASIASISALAKVIPFLSGLLKLPSAVIGIIQGILPPVFLAILTALLPIILRYLSKLEGIPSKTGITYSMLNKYYFFLMVNVLFVVTLSKGVFETISSILQNPTSSVSLLATNVPKASTFFITYVLLNALNSSGITILQIAPLAITFVYDKILAKTPRAYYSLWSSLGSVDMGQLVPQQTLMFSIGLVYSVISPLILPFVMLYFYIYYFVYMYQFLYSFNTEIETGGQAFPKAIRHIYISVFIFELLMVGILLGKSALAQGIIMIIIIVITAFVLYLMDFSFTQLLTCVPVTLADSKLSEDAAFKELEEKKRFGLIGAGADLVSGIVSKTTETVGAGVKIITSPVEKIAKNIPFTIKGNKESGGEISEEDKRLLEQAREENESHAYLHPALRSQQPTIWIPHDDYGICDDLTKDLETDNLKCSTIGATIVEEKGGPKLVIAKELFETPLGASGMSAPVDGAQNKVAKAISAGIYADNAMGLVTGDIGMMMS